MKLGITIDEQIAQAQKDYDYMAFQYYSQLKAQQEQADIKSATLFHIKDDLTKLYSELLGRTPTAAELDTFSSQIYDKTNTIENLRNTILKSEEFIRIHEPKIIDSKPPVKKIKAGWIAAAAATAAALFLG